MAKCDTCGTTILFGGFRENGFRFCSKKCQQNGHLAKVAIQIPDDLIAEHVEELHGGNCPKCGGPGPVDVHTSHVVISAVVMTTWKSRPEICCRSCGVKAKLSGAAISAVAGWWGFPWGILATPIQIGRNLSGVFSSPDPSQPSAQLEKFVRANIAAQFLESKRREGESG